MVGTHIQVIDSSKLDKGRADRPVIRRECHFAASLGDFDQGIAPEPSSPDPTCSPSRPRAWLSRLALAPGPGAWPTVRPTVRPTVWPTKGTAMGFRHPRRAVAGV